MDARPQIGVENLRDYGPPVEVGGICNDHNRMPGARLRQSDTFSQKVFHPRPRLLTVSRPRPGRNALCGGSALGASIDVLEQSFHQVPERGIYFCQFRQMRVHPVHRR